MPNDLRVRTLGNIRNPPNQNEDCGNSAKKTPKRPYADKDRPHANPWKEPRPDRPSRHKRQEFPPLAKHGSHHPRHRPKPASPPEHGDRHPKYCMPPLKTNSSHTPEMTESFCNCLVMTLGTFHNLMLQMSSLGLRFVKLFLHKTKGKVFPHNFQEKRK